jgi:hypothetical protein
VSLSKLGGADSHLDKSKSELISFAKNLTATAEQTILFSKEKGTKQDLVNLVSKLEWIDVKGRMQVERRIQGDRSVEVLGLKENYSSYISSDVSMEWETLFKSLLRQLDGIILEALEAKP